MSIASDGLNGLNAVNGAMGVASSPSKPSSPPPPPHEERSAAAGLLDWMEDALDTLCNTSGIQDADGQTSSDSSLESAGGYVGAGTKAYMDAVNSAGVICRRATQTAVVRVMESIEPSHTTPTNTTTPATMLKEWYHATWREAGGVAAIAGGSGQSNKCCVRLRSVGVHKTAELLEAATVEVSRQLTGLPEVVDMDAIGEVIVDVQNHPLKAVVRAALREVEVVGVPSVEGVHGATKAMLAALATVAAEACRDVFEAVTQIAHHTPLRKLDVRGLSYQAGEGAVQAAKALSKLRSDHRQAVLYLATKSLAQLKAVERTAIMLLEDGTVVLKVCVCV